MANLCKYNGISRCSEISWDQQRDCEYAEKSPRRHCCRHMRLDGTCDNEKIPAVDKEKA